MSASASSGVRHLDMAPYAPGPEPGCSGRKRHDSELLDDVLRLLAGERAQRLRLLSSVVAELRDDLEGRVVVGRLEDLDHVVAPQRHPDADELPAGLLDLPRAVLDPVAPGGEPHPPLRGPADERDVVRHALIFSGCA